MVQAAVDQVTALGEERNASRNLPVEIDPQVGGKGHFDTAETLRPGCCIQLVVGPFTGALQPDARAERNLAAVVVGGKIAIESRGTVMEFGLVVVIDIAVHAQLRPETARGTPRHLAVERQDGLAGHRRQHGQPGGKNIAPLHDIGTVPVKVVVTDREPGIGPVVELPAPDTAPDTEAAVVIDRTLSPEYGIQQIGIQLRKRTVTVLADVAVHLEERAQPVRPEVQVQPHERNDIIFRFDGLDLVVVIIGTDLEAHYPALDAVAQRGMYQLLVIFVEGLLSGEPLVTDLGGKAVAPESAGDLRVGFQRGLAGLVVIVRPLGMVEKHAAPDGDFEIHAAQILEIVAEAHRDVRIAVIGHRTGYGIGRDVRREVHTVAVVHAVLVGEVALEHVAAEIFTRSGADAVEHPRRIVLDAEVVPDLGIAPLVVDIAHHIPCPGVLARSIEIQHRIERVAHPGLEVERQRAVEFPVGYRRGTDRPRGEGGLQRQRRDRIVDLGTHLHRIGHVGYDSEFRRSLHTRHIGLGHFDPFLDLRARAPGQCRHQRGYKQHVFHRQFSFAIRSLASSTIPSSAGE